MTEDTPNEVGDSRAVVSGLIDEFQVRASEVAVEEAIQRADELFDHLEGTADPDERRNMIRALLVKYERSLRTATLGSGLYSALLFGSNELARDLLKAAIGTRFAE